MTELSFPWATGTGDGHAYTQDEVRDLWALVTYRFPGASEAVFRGRLNELAVASTGNNNVRIASGFGVVNGTSYSNSANLDITVTSPSGGTTGFLVLLRKSWVTQTVRAAVLKNTDGVSTIPSVTQSDGVTWEVALASGTITSGGVISALTDLRQYLPLSAPLSIYGDGSDGNVTISGNTTLARDMYYDTLTVNAGFTLTTAGFRVFAKTAIVNNGTIANPGGNGASGNTPAAGAGGAAGTLGGGGAGAAPGTTNSASGGGGGGIVLLVAPSITGTGTIHADGGNGATGTASASVGGTTTATIPTAANGGVEGVKSLANTLTGRTPTGTAWNGGGGGGGVGSTSGGAATAVTSALGGNGGAASSGSGSGGGGGGAVILITRVPYAGSLTLRANGGSPGGTATAGSAGRTFNLVAS